MHSLEEIPVAGRRMKLLRGISAHVTAELKLVVCYWSSCRPWLLLLVFEAGGQGSCWLQCHSRWLMMAGDVMWKELIKKIERVRCLFGNVRKNEMGVWKMEGWRLRVGFFFFFFFFFQENVFLRVCEPVSGREFWYVWFLPKILLSSCVWYNYLFIDKTSLFFSFNCLVFKKLKNILIFHFPFLQFWFPCLNFFFFKKVTSILTQ